MPRLAPALLSPLLLAACTGEITTQRYSPDDPAEFDERMFDPAALSGYSLEDAAYVQGHAIGVYLYGKTLPVATGPKGYVYEPGISSPRSGVPYTWDAVMVAVSGGVDGYGSIYLEEDDVSPGGDNPEDVGPGDTWPPNDGDDPGGGGGDPSGDPGGDPDDPGGGGGDPSGDPDDPGGDDVPPGGDDPDDPYIDPDCEEFLDPAAMEARRLGELVNPDAVLAGNPNVTAFAVGLREALYLEDLDENTDHSEVEHIKNDVQDYGMCEHSPLVLDLGGDGIAVGAAGDGVAFDLLARGAAVTTAWPSGDDALLAIDRDGDGAIGSGAELFGNQPALSGSKGAAHGFAALAALDGDGNGAIDAADPAYARLLVWRDTDRDGASAPAELSSLAAAGVVSIDLGFAPSRDRDDAGNRHAQRGTFVLDTGAGLAARDITDVWFRYRR